LAFEDTGLKHIAIADPWRKRLLFWIRGAPN